MKKNKTQLCLDGVSFVSSLTNNIPVIEAAAITIVFRALQRYKEQRDEEGPAYLIRHPIHVLHTLHFLCRSSARNLKRWRPREHKALRECEG